MIYYIVTKGHYPFEARNILQLINMALNQPPTGPKTYNKRISNEFENLILMLLSKQPYERNISHEELEEAIKTTPIILETVISTSRKTSKLKKEVWYRLLPTEKSEILEFIKNSGELNGIEYVANYLPRYQKTLKELQEKNVKYFFDPATNRLAYSTFSQTKGLVALPYCWDSFNRLTPDKLKDITPIKRYVSQVIDWQAQWDVDFFVAPFHYHHNLGDAWLETDIKLLHETVDYARKKYKNKKVYSGICLNMEEYTTETNRLALLNEFSICKPDGFIFYGDEINETTTNPARLYAYVETMRLFSRLGEKIIGARLGTLGLGVLAAGADIVTTGIASLTGFSERGLLQERAKGYPMKTKYYIPQLMLSLPVKLAEDIINEDKSLACNCNFCKKSSNIEAVAKIHYLKIRQTEIEEMNSIEGNFRLEWFVEKTQRAINRCKELHPVVSELRPSYYAHLNTWLNVFGSYLEEKTDEI